MKKKILTLLFSVIIIIVIPTYGQLSKNITVDTPGTLESQLGTDKTKVTDLVLTRTINNADFTTIKQMSSLKNLDIKNITNNTIPPEAFLNKVMTGLILPANLKVVGIKSFSGMSALSLDFTFCLDLEQIDNQAFLKTTLTNATLDFSKCKLLAHFPIDAYGKGPFTGYTGHVILPVNMKYIPTCTFYGFSGSVDLPPLVETIGPKAFYSSKQIKTLILPATLKTIQQEAFMSMESTELDFSHCLQLEEIQVRAFSGLKLVNTTLDFSKCLTISNLIGDSWGKGPFTGYSGHVILPVNMKHIPACSFNGFSGSLDLPPSLESIGVQSFNGSKLKGSLVLPSTLKTIQKEAFISMEVTELNFSQCLQLEEIHIRAFAGLKLVNSTLDFSECKLLARLINDAYGKGPFTGYSGHVILPVNMKYIPACSFNGFSGSVTFPPVLETIGESAFTNAVLTKGIIFPNSLKTIGAKAFYNSTIPSVSFEQMDPTQSGVSCF